MISIRFLFVFLISITFAAALQTSNGKTKKDAVPLPLVQLGSGFYYFENNIMGNWYQAMEFCRNHDMYLVSVETKAENDLLVNYVQAQGFTNSYWTSGNDLSVDNDYFWSSTGQRLGYTNWDWQSPSHTNTSNGFEHCIQFRFFNGSWWWDDLHAATQIYFICEEICEKCPAIPIQGKKTQIKTKATDNPLVNLNGTNYYFENNLRANWYEALDFCRTHGMQLLSLETKQEELLVLNHLNSTLPGYANHWMSATDLGVQNTWVWSSTGLRMTSNNWAIGEPSGIDSLGRPENAAYLGMTSNGVIEWYDSFEYDVRYTICEQTCMTSCQSDK